MANTYELLSSNTLSSSASSVTFSSIPQTYTDLVLRMSTRDATNGATYGSALITINGSSASVYSYQRLLLTGPSTVSSTAVSGGNSSFSISPIGNGSTAPTNSFGFCEIYIANYKSTSTVYLSTTSFASGGTSVVSPTLTNGSWGGAAAITSITIASNGGTFATASSFNLYGINNS